MTAQDVDSDFGFLVPAAPSPDVERLFAEDRGEGGYVMNLTQAWAHVPETQQAFVELIRNTSARAGLTFGQRGVLVSALAGAMGDPHCSLAWGTRLAAECGEEVAAGVLRGEDDGLDAADRALARWARQLARDPNGTGPGDVQALRDAGFDDARIAALSVYVALRIAFSTVNDALGARPDRQLVAAAPEQVRTVVSYGRPPADGNSPS